MGSFSKPTEVPPMNEKPLYVPAKPKEPRGPAYDNICLQGPSVPLPFLCVPTSALDMKILLLAAKGRRRRGTEQRKKESSPSPFPTAAVRPRGLGETGNCDRHCSVFKHYLRVTFILMMKLIVLGM